MTSGTDRTGVDGFGGDSPVQDPVSWNSQGSGVTLSSAGLYNLDTKVFCPEARGCSSEGYVHTEQWLYLSSNSG